MKCTNITVVFTVDGSALSKFLQLRFKTKGKITTLVLQGKGIAHSKENVSGIDILTLAGEGLVNRDAPLSVFPIDRFDRFSDQNGPLKNHRDFPK